MTGVRGARRRFCLVLVKPSHYDDDGYVIQWMRSPIPSNSLASLYGLARDCAERRILGDDVDIDIHVFDETNTRIRPERLAAMVEAADAGMVMLAGVQSNQFPRALDLARPLRARGVQVGIGGFHVSGVLAMLGGADPDLDRARAMGVSLFAGEAEGRLERCLRDAAAGRLQPLYNYMDDLPGIEGTPIPLMAVERAQRTAGGTTSFDAGRGCPYQCSFCTIINVQGRKSRRRSPDDIERIVRMNYAQGLRAFLHHRRQFRPQQGLGDRSSIASFACAKPKSSISASSSRSTRCATSCRISSRNARAPASSACSSAWRTSTRTISLGAKKRQNKITEYRQMLLAWKKPASSPMPATSSAFPNDTIVDHARHRRDQARAAGRPAGILLSDAAAGLRGSSQAVSRPARRSIRT